MKLSSTIHNPRFAIWKKPAQPAVAGRRGRAAGNRKSKIENRKSEEGIALVITLILLSVTLVMAIAFLAISRRERSSVTTSTDTATARLAADAALANAQAQIIATIYATANPYNSGLVVSTNFINVNGFKNTGAGVADPTNVNYDFYNGAGGVPLNNPADLEQNIANLFYLPRAPVFVVTNRQTLASDFRFYLDLNRNGQFENTGVVTNYDNLGNVIFDSSTKAATNFQTGDPQWIGVLERPDVPHGPNNKFVSRYAFVAMPADGALDLNAIHNQAKRISPAQDGFLRNQGVGSWELNLAAFLTDLNTNQWDPNANQYFYNTNSAQSSTLGPGFDDALSLLRFRYSANNPPTAATGNYNNLAGLFFDNGNIDEYANGNSSGALMTTPSWNNDFNDSGPGFPGADNPARFFDVSSDLFDPAKSSANFTNRLQLAGNTNSTYDRYTFYRLLAQLGTDSAPESGKMNLNYDNLDFAGNVVAGAETNLIPWTNSIKFFTNAADRMLREYTATWFQASPSNYLATYYGIHTNYYYTDGSGNIHINDSNGIGLTSLLGVPNVLGLASDGVPSFGITNIPVFVKSNYVYSSAVQRVLQLAANLYDATTPRYYGSPGFSLPSVFRPFFYKTNSNVYILGFNEVTDITQALAEPYNLKNPLVMASLNPGIYNINVFGVPQIVGAKKGLPNFNQFVMQNIFQVTRKVRLSRSSTTAALDTYAIDQQFAFGSATNSGIANQLEVQCWNSYPTNYARSTDIYVTNWLTMSLTNDEGFSTNATLVLSGYTNITGWPAYNPLSPTASFRIPLNTNAVFVPPNSVYRFNSGAPYLTSDPAQLGIFESNVVINGSSYPQPHWSLVVTNNIQVAMVDSITRRLIDYVQLSGPNSARDVTQELMNSTNTSALWGTNYIQSMLGIRLPAGVSHQLDQSKTYGGNSISAGGFNNFTRQLNNGQPYGNTNLQFQAWSPPTTMYQTTIWQANDPLVHYLASDLFDYKNVGMAQSPTAENSILNTPGKPVSDRYQPWGAAGISPWNLALKDPLVWSSDHWDFPTNKFPTVGWLGRVHRGTPWQTVYLKSLGTDNNSWTNWTGNFNTYDATNAMPVQDRLLFNIFTTAINDNATRGQLSINVAANPKDSVAGLAAWSALLGGVTMLSNNLSDGNALSTYHTLNPQAGIPSLAASPVDPAGVNGLNSPLGKLVASINNTRTNTAIFPQQIFGTRFGVGDILSVPSLTDQSPFLHLSNYVNNAWVEDAQQKQNGISDEMYEWLPQQTMSLLRAPSAPRYVIYSYGQTLQPAPNGVVTGGSFFGTVTNYQVVAETATRAVVRLNPVVTTDINGVHTNYTIKIEQFNVLPPD